METASSPFDFDRSDVAADPTLNIILQLFDVDRSTILAQDGGGLACNRTVGRNDLKPETYYLGVSVDGPARYGGYSLSITSQPHAAANDAEPNDSSGTAKFLRLDAPVSGHLGYYSAGVTDGADWYSVQIGSAGKYTVSLEGDAPLNLRLSLLKSDAVTVVAQDSTGYMPKRTLRQIELAPGT